MFTMSLSTEFGEILGPLHFVADVLDQDRCCDSAIDLGLQRNTAESMLRISALGQAAHEQESPPSSCNVSDGRVRDRHL